ncbi:dihydrofolate reductase [Galactobacter valiniphilus]|uniref:Dihydrofolate reductase n=1 Tax=Galactobacter valiniphilus TaxID=2676122 RepID=A0A399JDG8_9MICC|nr:dihydrofolate reductase family protein [Galactobacter valiniphilus]RII43070.1 dihydrofolate reductase [Galactobacter valiniphilus]
MPRFIFDTACTLNGFLATKDHSLEWLFAVPGAEEPDPTLLPENISVLVEGSHTYEWVLKNEDILAHPERWQTFHGSRPTFVFSSRELPVPEGADVRIVSGDPADHLEAIRAAAGDGDVWILGGGELVGRFADAGALDRVALTLAPATLEDGHAVLPRSLGAERLTLVEARQAGPFARLVYDVARPT